MGSCSLLQGIFPTQGSNPGLLNCKRILYHLNHKGSPRKVGWFTSTFSRDLSHPAIEQRSPALQAECLSSELPGKPVKVKVFVGGLCVSPWTLTTRHLHLWTSPGKNTGVGSHSFLQEIFLTQGSNPGLLHCWQILYHLSHKRSIIILSGWGIPWYSIIFRSVTGL